jgi:hypothetical protein
MALSEKHIENALALRRCYPYRIIWAAIDLEGNEIQGADHTKRQINKMARLGYKIFILTTKEV